VPRAVTVTKTMKTSSDTILQQMSVISGELFFRHIYQNSVI